MTTIFGTNKQEVQEGQEVTPSANWRWYHGVLFYGIVQILTAGLAIMVTGIRTQKPASLDAAFGGDDDYYENLKLPRFAPPGNAFPIVWAINNALTVWGGLRALNMPSDQPGRNEYLRYQGGSWLLFILFNAAYFGLRSPINAAILTVLYFGLTLASGFVALFRLKDTKVALSLSTVTLWLLLAVPVALSVAARNRDDFYQAGPFVRASE